MYKKSFIIIGGLLIIGPQLIHAHSHHNTYIVEQPQTVVVVQQAPTPVLVPAPSVNVITVESQPPADIVEQMTPSPGIGYVWKQGYWKWNGNWVWVSGSWALPPHAGGVYVPGHWRQSHHHNHRWEWEDSHWR